jgi:hypothetical protein
MVIRGLLVIALLAAALTAGLLAYSKNGRSQTPPAACAGLNCDPTLPGGWPTDPNRP